MNRGSDRVLLMKTGTLGDFKGWWLLNDVFPSRLMVGKHKCSAHLHFAMDNLDANTNNSDCELVSENEVISMVKQKNQKRKKDGKPPSAPSVSQPCSTRANKKRSKWWDHYGLKDIIMKQPTIIIDETWDDL
ncbi:hypothetical protein L1987_50753 [Smallanthus sonchifolius]|uniref:Uncharacterized protein n=1 Tax=Smallanthus sonchifolius TaxID=185202 RepID=A0ACB9EMW6_9ASTR|nr:hypothetical protein L1987_50753 [Smallanthus sonchifolius]